MRIGSGAGLSFPKRGSVGAVFSALAFAALALGGSADSARAAAAMARAAGTVCGKDSAAAPAMTRLQASMAQGRFVTYQPTSLQVVNGRLTHADPASIRTDLQVLRPRFDSLITYGSINGAEAIPAIAASLGFRAVIIGIWNPFDATELNAAIAAAKDNPKLVTGLSLGNEMVFSHRRTFADLAKLLEAVHAQLPTLPLATTEPFHMFYETAAAPLLERADFLLVNVHPIFEPWFRTAPDGDAAQFVANVVSKLAQSYCGPILVKETGVPTLPESSGFTEKRQASFYAELRRRLSASNERAFAYFAAFDAPWRLHDVSAVPGQPPKLEEAHWGLYDARRQPKPVVAQLPLLERQTP
ncbi:MAG: Exo-beta 3-glucanase-like protein [Gammaproteobacteria bacterium]|nr:Exo-beta 3-glucanase-like protein [Gammaproteobacteria bacterium]